MLVAELETPAVVVDLDVMEQNLSRMADYCREHRLLLRPHTKSHKIPELAKRQIASGATGITVAKLGEAEVMLDACITDILIAYPSWEQRRRSAWQRSRSVPPLPWPWMRRSSTRFPRPCRGREPKWEFWSSLTRAFIVAA